MRNPAGVDRIGCSVHSDFVDTHTAGGPKVTLPRWTSEICLRMYHDEREKFRSRAQSWG